MICGRLAGVGNFCYNKDPDVADNCIFQRPQPGNHGNPQP